MLFYIKGKICMYHFLQSNGLDERFNQTIKSMVVKFVNKKSSNWDGCIQHSKTLFNPFELPIQLETNGDDPNKVLHEFQNAPALDENPASLKVTEGRSRRSKSKHQNCTREAAWALQRKACKSWSVSSWKQGPRQRFYPKKMTSGQNGLQVA